MVDKIGVGLIMGSVVVVFYIGVSYIFNVSNFIVIIKVVVIVVHIFVCHYYYFFIFFMGLLPFIKDCLPSAGFIINIVTIRDI